MNPRLIILPGLAVLPFLALLTACEDPSARDMRLAKERTYSLSQACIRRKGSPIVDGDEFKGCDYKRSFGFKKE